MELKEVSDEEMVQEFIDGTPHWYDSLTEEAKERDHCVMCGVPPTYLKRLAEILKKKLPLLTSPNEKEL